MINNIVHVAIILQCLAVALITGEMRMGCDANFCRVLRISDVVALTNLSRSTIYYLMKTGDFPRQIKIGGCSCWLKSDVSGWFDNKFNVKKQGVSGVDSY
jgi:prophage regulatory protein